MRAVVLHKAGDIRCSEVPEPRIHEPTDAIVSVRLSALCGADLFPYHGMTPGFENGTVLGHEFVGIVEEVGDEVRLVTPGQRVVNTSTISCGACEHCRAGRPSQCLNRALFGYSGVYERLDGGQAERVRIPNADRVLGKIPDTVSDEAAVFLADMLPTGYSAVHRGGVDPGDVVCVLGCGTVGLMAFLCSVGIAGRVVAVDGIPARRELAASLGAEAVEPEHAAEAVGSGEGRFGADVVIEAAGTPGALDAAFQLARGRGTVSVVGAHFEHDYPLDNLTMFEKELTLRFSWGDPVNDRDRLLGMIEAGSIDPTPTITHRLPLDEAAEAYRLFDSREATKVLLKT